MKDDLTYKLRCVACGRKMKNGYDALEHSEKDGHNKYEVLLPKLPLILAKEDGDIIRGKK